MDFREDLHWWQPILLKFDLDLVSKWEIHPILWNTELRIATLRKYSEYSITSILIKEIIQSYSMNAYFEENHKLTQKMNIE